jgi:hypothetical protein
MADEVIDVGGVVAVAVAALCCPLLLLVDGGGGICATRTSRIPSSYDTDCQYNVHADVVCVPLVSSDATYNQHLPNELDFALAVATSYTERHRILLLLLVIVVVVVVVVPLGHC